MRATGVMLTMMALAGCAAPPATSPAPTPAADIPLQLSHAARPSLDPAPAPPVIIHLEIHRIWVPFGTVSANEEFWKRIDEQCVDVATYDLLFKNGMRIGRAATAEWGYFKNLIDAHPAASSKNAYAAPQMDGIELELDEGIAAQTIFHFDGSNVMSGRTYENCTNVMSLSFQPAPRKPGAVRVALCPMVRSLRKRLEFTGLNEEREIQFISPERLYDVNLRADVPADSFLIIAPSSAARWPTSLGRAFLCRDGGSERLEQIMLVVPCSRVAEHVTGDGVQALR